jgi:hypothetical protein
MISVRKAKLAWAPKQRSYLKAMGPLAYNSCCTKQCAPSSMCSLSPSAIPTVSLLPAYLLPRLSLLSTMYSIHSPTVAMTTPPLLVARGHKCLMMLSAAEEGPPMTLTASLQLLHSAFGALGVSTLTCTCSPLSEAERF